MKTIYFDGLGLVDGHFSGVGQYILGILRGLDQLTDEAKYKGKQIPEIKVIIPRDSLKRYQSFGFKHISPKTIPIPFRYMAALWSRGKLPPIDIFCGRGTYIFPRFVDMPLLFNKSAGLVIFDLSYELHKQYADEGNAQFLSNGVKKSIKKTKEIISISENARLEIINFYNVPPSKVKVATPAVDQRVFYRRSQGEIDLVKLKYGINSKNYILALSNLEPRKNLAALIEAYCRLPKKMRVDTALLLVGVSGWKAESLYEDIVRRVEEGYNIIRPSSYVKDADKPAIISGSKMLVYPSHYEGFGMPPLEAMACGVPVITADNSSLPEVVGDTGIMVKSTDREALYNEIVLLLNNIDAATKKMLIDGPMQAEKFSWTKSAQVFLDVAEAAK